jgi:hypothetical protein
MIVPMKKKMILSVFLFSLFGCNKNLVEKPDTLIEKKVMLNIMYDMALLDVLKYQDPNSLYTHAINPKNYIYTKYKVDSLQLVKSNVYYAADYREYKKMYDTLNSRLKKEKIQVDFLIKKEHDKAKKTSLKK